MLHFDPVFLFRPAFRCVYNLICILPLMLHFNWHKNLSFAAPTLTEESYESACHNQEGADQWYFGSIAQVTLAAVDIALVDRRP